MKQFAILARVAAAALTNVSAVWGLALVSVAALGWAGAFVTWGLRHGHWYGSPRPDGRAG